MKWVAMRTGLSPHVIRVWERRYGAVQPARTGTQRRLYSENEVERLSLLRAVTEGGHSIGTVAKLPTAKLRELVGHEHANDKASPTPSVTVPALAPPLAEHDTAAGILTECVTAMKSLDAPALDAAMRRGLVALGNQGLLRLVVGPLVQSTGEMWREGEITAAHEHFVSAAMRTFLGRTAGGFGESGGAPLVVVGTPTGQIHELGALLAGATAANLGWRVVYLGASLPAAEIAGAALQRGARAVALSLVYPEDDPSLEKELSSLRELLPEGTALLIGGRAAAAYSRGIEKIGARLVGDLTDFGLALDQLRKPNPQS